MTNPLLRGRSATIAVTALCALLLRVPLFGHGTVIYPMSRVYRVYEANPDNPSLDLATQAVSIDGTLSYYTWNELSRNIPEAVTAGLPPAFDYSSWVPDGQLASGGRVDPASPDYPRTYAGLDQVSDAWPTTTLTAGETIEIDFLATAPHDPSVWDVWMTTPDWTPLEPLTWGKLEFLGRPAPVLIADHYYFDLTIPTDRSGHHVIWIAWHRDDPVGEVFFSASDVFIEGGMAPPQFIRGDCNSDGAVDISDAVASLAVLFTGGTTECADACDANDDGAQDIADAVATLASLFSGGGALPQPTGVCGSDSTADSLDCGALLVCP
ncbi:MAG: lytic polysaccharide monooxygenase [Planctomycetota bacterium]